MTFLPGFVPHGYPVAATVVLFGAVFIVLNVAYFLLLLALAGRVSAWMGTPNVRRRMELVTGTVLVGLRDPAGRGVLTPYSPMLCGHRPGEVVAAQVGLADVLPQVVEHPRVGGLGVVTLALVVGLGQDDPVVHGDLVGLLAAVDDAGVEGLAQFVGRVAGPVVELLVLVGVPGHVPHDAVAEALLLLQPRARCRRP